MPLIFEKYDKSLYNWILRLTEEFDLSFPVYEKQKRKQNDDKLPMMSLVPCLLPEMKDIESIFDLNLKKNHSQNNLVKVKEFKVLYIFEYLPAGIEYKHILFSFLKLRKYYGKH